MARLFAATVFIVLFNLSLAHAGHWETIYTCDGTTFGLQPGNIYPQTYTWGPLGNAKTSYNDAFDGGVSKTSTSGTVTVTITWQPDYVGDHSTPTPKKLWLSETAQAGWTASAGPEGNYSGPVTVGLGGEGEVTEGMNPDGSYYKQITKHKMTQVDASSGTIVRTCSLNAEVTGAGRSYPGDDEDEYFSYGGQMSAFGGFGVNIVYKGVLLTSSRDTTYRRGVENGVPMRVPNFPDEDGTTNADCRGNNDTPLDIPIIGGWFHDNQRITYTAEKLGSWGWMTTYQWDWNNGQSDWLTGPSGGQWNWEGPAWIDLLYQATSHGMPESTENIHFKATDPADGVSVDAHYHMKFHYEYENPAVLDQWQSPADPTGHSEEDILPGGWNLLTTYSYTEEKSGVTVNMPVTFEAGTEGSVEVGSGGDAFNKQVTVKVMQKYTKKYTATFNVPVTYPSAPSNKIYKLYWAAYTTFKSGTCEWWDNDGYQQDAAWSASDTSPVASTWLVVKTVGQD